MLCHGSLQVNVLYHSSNVVTYVFWCTGTLFSSMMFPDRAPNDLYLYTTFIGGSRNSDLAKASTYGNLVSYPSVLYIFHQFLVAPFIVVLIIYFLQLTFFSC